jgi:hypothetical protein
MSLKTLHSVIVFAAMSIALVFAVWCFFSPDNAGSTTDLIAGIASIAVAGGLIAYEVHYLKRTRKLIIH